jgi:CMP-N-acetylneuraminic acid synthetase
MTKPKALQLTPVAETRHLEEIRESSPRSWRAEAPFDETTSHQRSVLAIIPARGGSKGIPRKNIQNVAGKPLIAYTIEVALAASNINRVIVSTDDGEIADVAVRYGAEVPFLRPTRLASDSAEIQAALLYLRNRLFAEERYAPSAEVVMYPTHPFRKVSQVEKLVGLLLDGYALVNTYKQIVPSQSGYLYEDAGLMRPLTDHCRSPINRVYHRGYGYFLGRSFEQAAFKLYAHVLHSDIESIDIDNWEDLYLAEYIMRQGLYDFEL